MSASNEPDSAASPGSNAAPRQAPRRWRWLRSKQMTWWSFGATLALGSALLALFQHTHRDPMRPRQSVTDARWWLDPFQRNAAFSVANVGGAIDSVTALDGGEFIWALVSGQILVHSTNGGGNWRQISFPRQTNELFTAVYFSDVSTGWLMGKGVMLRTTDSGFTWQRHSLAGSPSFDAVHFADKRRGWGRIEGEFYATNDGGLTWAAYTPALPRNRSAAPLVIELRILPNGRGWCVGDDGAVFATSDFGATWSSLPVISETLFPKTNLSAPPSGPSAASLPASKIPSRARLARAPRYAEINVPALNAARPPNSKLPDQNPQQQQSKYVPPNSAEIAATPAWPSLVRTFETKQNGEVIIWLHDGSALILPAGAAAWQRRPPALPGTPGFTQLVSLGEGEVLGATEDCLSRLSGATLRLLLCGVGPAMTLDFARDSAGREILWLAGQGGLLLRSVDNGNDWEPVDSPTRSGILAADFLDGNTGLIGDVDGHVFRTIDGARTWTTLAVPATKGITSIVQLDANTAAFANGRQLFQTSDSGHTWHEVSLPPSRSETEVSALTRLDGTSILVAGNKIIAYRYDFSSASGQGHESGVTLPKPTTRYRYFQTFSNGRAAALEMPGRLLIRRDVKSDFVPLGDQVFVTLAFAEDSLNGYGVSLQGAVLRTTDGGVNWERANAPAFSVPAPWYWLTWLPVGLCFLRATRREPAEDERVLKSISAKATPDAPIGTNDPDVLGLGKVARGLSRFFRNRATVGPFTVAVAGEWGSGKTSFMRLMREDLEANDMRPVWFNAWHQQNEEHYLPALLETITAQAVPPIWVASGWGFRSRLISGRLWSARGKIFLLLTIAAFFGSLLSRGDASQIFAGMNDVASRVWNQVSHVLGTGEKPSETPEGPEPAKMDMPKPNGSEAVQKTILVGGVTTSLLALLHVLLSTFKAFGVEPAQLLAKAATGRNRDVEARMSFQRRFARDFSQVTSALGEVPLVIFIDDLDRCKPEKTVEMLEAVNFLVASGACFVVLGLAKAQVEACVGLAYRDIAEELAAPGTDAGPIAKEGQEAMDKRRATTERRKFARNYLEKLINLEIPIPPPTGTQRAELLSGRTQQMVPSSEPKRAWQRWVRTMITKPRRSFKRNFFSTVLCASVLFLAWETGKIIRPVRTIEPREETPAPAANPSVTTPRSSPDDITARETTASAGANQPSQFPPALHNPGVGSAPTLLVAFALAGALLSFVGLVAQRRETLPDDSPKFVAALEDWSPVIEQTHPTPRALKRFVNRIRYFAMQQQSGEAIPPSKQPRWMDWVSTKLCGMPPPTAVEKESEAIPEDILVALAAINGAALANTIEPFGEKNFSDTAGFAAQQYAASHDPRDPTVPPFITLYPRNRLLQYQGEYLRLAAGTQPK